MPHSRRTFLAAASAAAAFNHSMTRAAQTSNGQGLAELSTISLQADRYHGWPTLTRRQNGELLVVCSGGRETHVCPFGRVELIRSSDGGKTWSYARTIHDGPIDDRDAGIIETAKGTLLVSTFTSLAYEPNLKKALATADSDKPSMSQDRLNRWLGSHRRTSDEQRPKELGCWMLRSEDGGLSWSTAYRVPLNSPHGPVNLSDGRLFYAGVELWTDARRVVACISDDDGRTWEHLSEIPARQGDDPQKYHELHAVEASDGRLIVHIRNHNAKNAGETLQTHSSDGGKSWATPYSIGTWGLPSHLLKLGDGRLLMSYGHRRKPLGNQAKISEDNGDSWSSPIMIHGSASSGDLGYPSTVETAPGKMVTVWYEKLADNPLAQLRMGRWQLPG